MGLGQGRQQGRRDALQLLATPDPDPDPYPDPNPNSGPETWPLTLDPDPNPSQDDAMRNYGAEIVKQCASCERDGVLLRFISAQP